MDKSVAIIGAGIAGLCAGCYTRMNGYRATIYELHDRPGGLCTSWDRKGYTIDGCLHWLVGSSPASKFHDVWREVGAVQGRQMVDHEEFGRVVAPDGKTFILYTDIDRFEQHMLELAPGDAKVIKQFTGAVRKLAPFDPPLGKPREIATVVDKLKGLIRMAPVLPIFIKWSRLSVHDFARRFKDPFLRKVFPVAFDLPGFPMLAMQMTLGWMHNKTAGYPIGGSLEFARAIEKRFLELGGEIQYNSRVEKILVQGDRATGVRLSDGSEYTADIVISAADGHATLFDMLDGKYLDDEIRGYYDHMPRFKSLVYVGLGVDRNLSDEPHQVVYLLDEPMEILGQRHSHFFVRHFCYDPTLAPEGKSVVVSMFEAELDTWKALREDKQRYCDEKRQVADQVIAQLENLSPGITDQVEMVDVATPVTFERYTGNWEGSMEGWLLTTENMIKPMKRTLPGLEDFYMVGQWVQPGGGVPTGAITAREIIQVICHKDGRKFTTTTP